MTKQLQHEYRQISLLAMLVGMSLACLWLSLARTFGTGMVVLVPLWWVLVAGFSTGNSRFSQLLYDASYYASIVLTVVLLSLVLWFMVT